MDEKRADLRAALREIAATESGGIGPHVGSKRLIAYRQGTLPAAEHDAVQEHLSLCARCTGLLRELRDFEAAAGGGAAGPEPLKEEAWGALVQRLPPKTPAIRPVLPPPRLRRAPYFVYAMAATLLLAVAGLSLWSVAAVQRERQRVAQLERRLEEREQALDAAQRSLAEAGRQLDAARGRIRQGVEQGGVSRSREEELAARVAELTSEVEKLRRRQPPDRLAAAVPASAIEVGIAPRFVLRGEEATEPVLRGEGAVNPAPLQAGRLALALDLPEASNYSDIRIDLTDRNGQVLWSGRRPGTSVVGDAGTSVNVDGLGPGRYRLRIHGLKPRARLLAEYLLEVEPSPSQPQ